MEHLPLGPQKRHLRFFFCYNSIISGLKHFHTISILYPFIFRFLRNTILETMAKSYTIKAQLIKDDAYLYPLQFYVPTEIIEVLKVDKIKRIHISINNHDPFAGSLIPGGDQQYYIKINTSQMKKMSLEIGDTATLTITPDQSEYGMPLPQEFAAIWEIDDEAHHHFHNLTPGKQRNLIYIVNSVKSLDIKARKATVIMDHLKINNGKLDFKVLNESLKSK